MTNTSKSRHFYRQALSVNHPLDIYKYAQSATAISTPCTGHCYKKPYPCNSVFNAMTKCSSCTIHLPGMSLSPGVRCRVLGVGFFKCAADHRPPVTAAALFSIRLRQPCQTSRISVLSIRASAQRSLISRPSAPVMA